MEAIAQKKKKSGMNADRSYRLQRRFISKINDIYSMAILCHYSHDKLGESLRQEIFESPEWNDVPERVRSYVSGFWECKRDNLWKYHVTWMLSCDGKLMTSKEVDALTMSEKEELRRKFCLNESDREELWMPKDYRSPWSRIDSEKSCHVWVENGQPLRDKPFR